MLWSDRAAVLHSKLSNRGIALDDTLPHCARTGCSPLNSRLLAAKRAVREIGWKWGRSWRIIAPMKTVLQLDALTRQEKLRAMEELWEDLTRADEQYESPDWHGDVLRAREEALKAGKDEFVPWDEAKGLLRETKR